MATTNDRETRAPAATHFEAVVFDLDGVLLDTESAYRAATEAVLGDLGASLSEALWQSCIGRPSAEVARLLVEALRLPVNAETFAGERRARVDGVLARCEPMPGARTLLAEVVARHVPVAIATSSTPATFALKTARHAAWLDAIEIVVTSADVPLGKPAPDGYLEAARRLGVPASRCLAFEDAPSGIEAACAAGMGVVAVPSPGVPAEACAAAALVLPSLSAVRLDEVLRLR